MAYYKCEVINEKGKTHHKKIAAIDDIDLKVQVKSEGWVLVKYKQLPEKKYSAFFTASFSVKREEVVVFLRQFSVMINAGISIDDSLNALRLQNYSKGLKEKLTKLNSDIISGVSLSDAFRYHKDIFPEFFCNMLEIAEMSGSLDSVLQSMADYYENDQKLRRKAKSSMAYPITLSVIIFAVVVFLAFVILPKFDVLFDEFGGTIPPISEFVFAAGAFIREYMFFIMIFLVFAILIFIVFVKYTKAGKRMKDYLSIHAPIVGRINNSIITSRFARAFAILLKSGMNLTDCMDNLANVLGNSIYIAQFKIVTEDVKRGKLLVNSLKNSNIFSKLLIQMIAIGEKSGNLEEVLESTYSFFDDQVNQDINKAISLMEPAIIIIDGIIVAIVLLAVYVPMIELMSTI